MKKKLIVFGAGDIAQLAHFYFSIDTDYDVVAFTVDATHIKETEVFGLPVVPFEYIEEKYPPDEFSLFVALSYSKLNEIRKVKYLAAKSLGYNIASYISSRATVLTQYEIGENCFVLENNTIQPFVMIGDNVTLWSGNHIGHHSVIESHSFISSHVVVSGGVRIGEQCFIGVNVTLRDHINIGKKTVLGAGSILLGDVEPEGVYITKATERSRVPSNKLRKI